MCLSKGIVDNDSRPKRRIGTRKWHNTWMLNENLLVIRPSNVNVQGNGKNDVFN